MIRKLTHAQIVKRQVELNRRPRMPVAVVLDNIRSLHNVGSIFRTADGAGIEKLWLCGITGYPPQGEISKTALGAEERVDWEYARDILCVLRQYQKQGYRLVVLEQAENAVAYDLFVPDGPVCLVVGNEVEGVSDPVAELADTAIEIPMSGIKNSLNAGVAFGIAAFALNRVFERIGYHK